MAEIKTLRYWLANPRTENLARLVLHWDAGRPHWTEVHRTKRETLLLRLGHGQEHNHTAPRE